MGIAGFELKLRPSADTQRLFLCTSVQEAS